MLKGEDLGAAIESARVLKGVSKAAIAKKFGVKPPSVQKWIKKGTIDKSKLPALWQYFADVVGPEHWGLVKYPMPMDADAEPPSPAPSLRLLLQSAAPVDFTKRTFTEEEWDVMQGLRIMPPEEYGPIRERALALKAHMDRLVKEHLRRLQNKPAENDS